MIYNLCAGLCFGAGAIACICVYDAASWFIERHMSRRASKNGAGTTDTTDTEALP